MNHKVSKQILSILLAVVMLVGLMPTTAFAATTIDTINIKGITTPVAGATPVVDGVTTDTAGITLTTVQWQKDGGVILNFSDKFEAGQTYYLWVRYEVAAGYEVSDDVTVTSDLANSTYEINTMRVKFQYTVPAAPKYTVTVTGGGTVEGKASVTTEAGTRLQLRAPEVSGKRFTGWSGLDEVTFYGDNAKVTDPVLGFIMPAKTFTVTANYQDAVEISTINIKGITKPLAGANPVNFGVTTDTTGLSVKEVIWYFDRTPSTNVPHDYEFQLGDKLYLLVFLDIADGYTFANSLTITADLEYTAAYRMPTTNTIYLEYTVTEEMPTTYTVSFDANDGTGTMTAATGISGDYVLPVCGFTAPNGKQFKAWSVGGVEKAVGSTINVTANTTVTAIWEAIEYNVSVTGGTASVGAGTPITKATMGTTVTLTAGAAPSGQMFDKWVVNGVVVDDANSATTTFVMPAGNVTAKATYKNIPVVTYTVSFDANGGTGSMADATGVSGDYVLPVCGFTAPNGKQFKAWSVGGVEKAAGDTITVNANTTVTAIWENIPVTYYTVTFDSNGGSAVTAQSIEAGQKATKPADPTKDGYDFKGWTLNGSAYDFNTAVNGNITLVATWEQKQVVPTTYTVTVNGSYASTTGAGEYAVGETVNISAGSRSNYSFNGWTSDDVTIANASSKNASFVMPEKNVTVTAQWKYTGGNSSGGGYTYYTIKATAGVNGAISPSGSVSVRSGKDQTFTITPDKGYAISDVKIDGKSVGAVKSYTFENVKGNHTIKAIFMKANGNPQTGVFVDVPEGSYYEEAVAWAVENGITKGTSDTTFEPNGICTRAQAVTFLWRAAGSPAPKTSTIPFTDVKAGSYYYDAVLWAVENGITKGTSDTTFSPDVTCSRAQIVTFLWRSQGVPAAGAVNPFTDVKADAYYADAVLWAVKEDVTKGTTDTTFDPNADCTRAQIVTFIWRALAE